MKMRMQCCLVLLVICCIAGNAYSATITTFLSGVTNTLGGGWTDVYQGSNDYNCWLATASNMLGYSGWNGGIGDASAIFSYADPLWGNSTGNPYYAVEWWFDGQNTHPANTATHTWPEVSGGGNFYTSQLFDEYPNNFPPTGTGNYLNMEDTAGLSLAALNNIITYVNDQRVFTVLLGTASGGFHFLTGWGANYDNVSNSLLGIWYTDSATSATEMLYSPVVFSAGKGYLDVYTNEYIISLERLRYNSGGVQPNGGSQVPEPTTLLLMGSGLFGLLIFSRKKR